MSTSGDISTLNTILLTTSNLPTLQSENKRIDLGSGKTPWCRSTLLPARTTQVSIGSSGIDNINGLYQIDLFYPQNSSYVLIYDMADAIINNFTIGSKSGGLHVINSYIQKLPGVTNYFNLAVIVEWQAFRDRP